MPFLAAIPAIAGVIGTAVTTGISIKNAVDQSKRQHAAPPTPALAPKQLPKEVLEGAVADTGKQLVAQLSGPERIATPSTARAA
jgi:hypothetical protein